MKKILLLISILAILAYSCKDQDVLQIPVHTTTQASQDHLKAEQIFNHINKIVEDAFLDNDQHKSCQAYSFDTITINNIETPAIIINFDAHSTGCIFFETMIMKGEIIAAYTGKFSDSSSIIRTSFNNYKVNEQLVQGEIIITNKGINDNGNMWFEITIINGSIVTPNGTINWETSRTKEWVEGSITTFERSDDKYKILGTGTGNSVNGNNFSVEITDTLIMDLSCPTCIITHGKARVSPDGYDDRIIHYGDEESNFSFCDCNVNIITNDISYPNIIGN